MNRQIKASVALIAAKAEMLNVKVEAGKIWTDDLQRGLAEIQQLAGEALQESRQYEGGDR